MSTTEKFYGVKLTDETGQVYYTEVEVSQKLVYKRNVQSVPLIDKQYPRHILVGKPKYWSGTCTAAFENNQNTQCEHDYKFGDTMWRMEFVEWLHNGLIKEMHLSESFVLPVAIMSEINVDPDNTVDDNVVRVTFQWEQCGDRIK